MLLFFHLFIGLIVGVLLAVLLSNRKAVLYCGFGGILPDLIDKPLGHIILAESINDGRIYFHSLTLLFILLTIGILLWARNEKRIGVFCIAIGVFLHQFGDFMFYSLQNWMWPLLGPFKQGTIYTPVDSGYQMLLETITWLTAIAIAGFVLTTAYLYLRPRLSSEDKIQNLAVASGGIAAGLLIALAVALGLGTILTGGVNSEYFDTMLLHEFISPSEWVYAIASLAVILVMVFFPGKLAERRAVGILRITGLCTLAAAVLIPVMVFSGLPVSFVYKGATEVLAISGLGLGGILLCICAKKLITGGEKTENPPETSEYE